MAPPAKKKTQGNLQAELGIAEARLLKVQISKKGEKKKAATKCTKTGSSTSTMRKGSKGQQQAVEDGGEGNSKAVVVNWALPEMLYLTHKLLSFIEDNVIWKVALGFEKGSNEQANSNGKSIIENCQTITQKLLIEDESGRWMGTDIQKLGEVVRNRINFIKKHYMSLRKDLGETGQGLLDEDHEADIKEDSPMWNVWVVGNNSTPLNIDMLRTLRTSDERRPTAKAQHADQYSSEWDIDALENDMSPEDEDLDLDLDLESRFSCPPSPKAAVNERFEGFDSEPGEGEDDIGLEGEERDQCEKVGRKCKSMDSESNQPKKRRMDAIDKAKAIADGQTQAQLEVITKTLHAHTQHEKIKQKTTLEIRRLEIEAEERHRREDCAHEH